MPKLFSLTAKSLLSRCILPLFVELAGAAALVGCSNGSSDGNVSSESEAAAKKQIQAAENAEMQRHEATPPDAASTPQ